MKNISNQEIFAENCTKCPTCGKASWYVMECDCGNIFCQYCSIPSEYDNDCIYLKCPICGKTMLYF